MAFFFSKRRRRHKSYLSSLLKANKFWVMMTLGLVLYFVGVNQGWWQKIEIDWQKGGVKETSSTEKEQSKSGEPKKSGEESPKSPAPAADSAVVILGTDNQLYDCGFDGSCRKVPRDQQNYKDFSSPDRNGYVLAILGGADQAGGDPAQRGDLIKFNLVDGRYEILQRDYPYSLAPALSPDGQKKADIAREGQEFTLYLSDLAGGNRQEIVRYPQPIFFARFSPDGNYLGYAVVQEGQSRVTVVNLSNLEKKELGGKGQILGLVPKNSSEAYAVFAVRDKSGTRSDIYAVSSGNLQQTTSDGNEKKDLFLSSDGKNLYYTQGQAVVRFNLESKETAKIGRGRLLGVK